MWANGDGSEMKWIALLVIVAFAATIAVIFVYAARRWKSGTEKLRARLDLARRPIGTKTYDPSELIGLPEPVQRYFRAALSGGQQVVAAVNVEHSGTILGGTPERTHTTGDCGSRALLRCRWWPDRLLAANCGHTRAHTHSPIAVIPDALAQLSVAAAHSEKSR